MTIASVRDYEETVKGSEGEVSVIDGLDHRQEFSEIERVLPALLRFTRET